MYTRIFSDEDVKALACWYGWLAGDEPTLHERKRIIGALARNRAVRDVVICSAISPLAWSEQSRQIDKMTVDDCLQNVLEGHVDVDRASLVYECLDSLVDNLDRDMALEYVAIASAQAFLDWATLTPTENLNVLRDTLIILTTLTLQYANDHSVADADTLLLRIVLDAFKRGKYPFEF